MPKGGLGGGEEGESRKMLVGRYDMLPYSGLVNFSESSFNYLYSQALEITQI